MSKHLTYIAYVVQTQDGPVFSHVKIHLDHTFSSGTLHDITQDAVIKWADMKEKNLPEGQQISILNFFTYETDN